MKVESLRLRSALVTGWVVLVLASCSMSFNDDGDSPATKDFSYIAVQAVAPGNDDVPNAMGHEVGDIYAGPSCFPGDIEIEAN